MTCAVSDFIVVDLPAPLGPSRPTQRPLGTSRSSPSTAVSAPKRLTTPRRVIALSATSGTATIVPQRLGLALRRPRSERLLAPHVGQTETVEQLRRAEDRDLTHLAPLQCQHDDGVGTEHVLAAVAHVLSEGQLPVGPCRDDPPARQSKRPLGQERADGAGTGIPLALRRH